MKMHTICNIYIPPGHQVTSEELRNLSDQLPRPFLLVGDFNGKHAAWGNNINDQRGRTIEQFLINSDVCLLNTGEATHLHTQTGTTSAIDLSLCTPDIVNDVRWMVMDDTYGSDHFPLVIEYETHQPANVQPRYILKRADWQTYEALTRMEEPEEDLTVDEMAENFSGALRVAASIAIPRSKGGTIQHRVPWWNDDCSRANLDRKRALRRFQRSGSIADKIAYQRSRAVAQYVKNTARKKSWQRYISSLNASTPMPKIWQRVKKIAGKPLYKQPCVMVNGAISADPQLVAAELARHFADISSGRHYPHPFRANRAQHEQQPLDFGTDRTFPYNDQITYLEFYSALQHYNKNTSPGPDGIHYKMLRKMHPTAVTALLALYNKIWSSHSFPSQWRTATVMAFLKPNKPLSEPSSYRPIALTSCVGKILERIANNRLVQYLESQNLISPVQYGFRPLRGTTEALVRLQNHIIKNKTEGKHTICVFFDMQKAYDTTWRHGILQFIHQSGIRGNLALYIREFLRHRSFRVKVGASLSPLHAQNQGVPQGSVISCTLFLMAINGITSSLPPDVQSSLYVDDFMLYASSRYLPALARRIQTAINRANQWTMAHGFSFSGEKTVAMHFKRDRSMEQPPPLFLQGTLITVSPIAKFLGMTWDCRLSWKPHLQVLKGSCLRRMNLIKHLSGKSWGSDRLTLLRLYRAILRTKIDYGCIIYQHARKQTLSLLDPVHNAAIRICTGAFRTSPTISLYAESGEPPLSLRRIQLTLQMIARLKQLPLSPTWLSVVTEDRPNIFPYNIPSSEDFETLLATTQVQQLQVIPVTFEDTPTWRIPINTFCPDQNFPLKPNTHPTEMRNLFFNHASTKHANSTHIYTDGSKTNGAVGCAATTATATVSRRLSSSSSIYTAELLGVLCALNLIDELPGDDFTIFIDSKSVVQALRTYNSKHPIIKEILAGLVRLAGAGRAVSVCWVPGHVGVRGNDRADEAAVGAASSDLAIHTEQVPCYDHYPIIKSNIRHIWHEQWMNVRENKLRAIKDCVKAWNSSYQKSRQMEVVLCRLRIGHTRLTHSHLIERRPVPYCNECLVPLTVLHVMAECPSHSDTRLNCYPNTTTLSADEMLTRMLREAPRSNFRTDNLRRYLIECGLLQEI